MKLRLSDVTAHAVEFEADGLASFKTALYEALLKYRGLFAHDAPRPHLHVWGGQWVDAGYGRGTRIVLHDNLFEDAAHLTEVWGRCESAAANVATFKNSLGQMINGVIAAASDGRILQEDDPEKLLRLPAQSPPSHSARGAGGEGSLSEALKTDLTARRHRLAKHINQRNLKFFDQEAQKLDAWADDLKVSLEQEIKDIDRQIRDLEQKRNKLRRELFDRQDEVEAKRDDLIAQLETQLQQQIQEQTLYTTDGIICDEDEEFEETQ